MSPERGCRRGRRSQTHRRKGPASTWAPQPREDGALLLTPDAAVVGGQRLARLGNGSRRLGGLDVLEQRLAPAFRERKVEAVDALREGFRLDAVGDVDVHIRREE